jgi:hypothetical protein
VRDVTAAALEPRIDAGQRAASIHETRFLSAVMHVLTENERDFFGAEFA